MVITAKATMQYDLSNGWKKALHSLISILLAKPTNVFFILVLKLLFLDDTGTMHP